MFSAIQCSQEDYSVHKRITVFSEQGQGNNKQTFVVKKSVCIIALK